VDRRRRSGSRVPLPFRRAHTRQCRPPRRGLPRLRDIYPRRRPRRLEECRPADHTRPQPADRHHAPGADRRRLAGPDRHDPRHARSAGLLCDLGLRRRRIAGRWRHRILRHGAHPGADALEPPRCRRGEMNALHTLLAIGSGSVVGFTLGLVGGGGSIMAVPLLVYVVGVASPHLAIGTSAVAVAVSAAANLIGHARARTVKWNCAIVFALAGIAGAAGGAYLGKLVDGERLLTLFGALMIAIGLLMLRPRKSGADPDVALTRDSLHLLPYLVGMGFLVGALSGFFGIGGGFLIVPG